MTDVRHFRRKDDAESKSQPFHWESKDHLLFDEITISVIVERQEFSGKDKWVVIVEKTRHSDGWESTDTVSQHACRGKAEAAAIEWMETLIETVVLTVADVHEFVDDGWTIIWRRSGEHANPAHKTIQLKRGFIQKTFCMRVDAFQTLEE
ncbi:hypothetical protein [Halocatena marina]|uniref:Uncharacterized protein n=1 Tax=Halocatena marina TaxID=2934937 RepID=A0ABD5YUU4_9EURY|nr:hypothetical protein [Halocatena marina]